MIDPETGLVDPERFGWDNRLTGGAKLGSSINISINSLTIDATTGFAFGLGFARGMQYEGMQRETDNLPGAQAILTNCFAATYAFMSSLDTAGYNRSMLSSPDPGTFGGFDVLVIDPIHVFADSVVSFEMCEIGKIIAMFKNNASLDYASIVDSSTRFIMVMMVESPEMRGEIMKLKDAGQCAQKVKEAYDEEVAKDKQEEEQQWEEFGGENAGDSSQWDTQDDQNWSFAADTGVFAADAEAAAKEAANCFNDINRFAIGEISGRLFAHLFNNELNPI